MCRNGSQTRNLPASPATLRLTGWTLCTQYPWFVKHGYKTAYEAMGLFAGAHYPQQSTD